MKRTTVPIPTRVLVLGMARHDGSLVAEEIHPVAAACRLSPDQVRSCLRRLVAEGLFTRDGAGRAARFRATRAGLAALGAHRERIRRAYRLDAGERWDGCWHLIGFAIPEARRASRDALRDAVVAQGGAAVQGGLYVLAHAAEPELGEEAKRLGVEGCLTCATTRDLEVGGVREPRVLAERLWPLQELAAGYRAFVREWESVPDVLDRMHDRAARLPDSSFLPGALAMAVAYLSCSERDPLLPPDLLPEPWPGRRAREILLHSRRAALAIRESQGRPPLFQMFDETTGGAP